MNPYNNLVLDLYVPDPEGQVTGAMFDLPSFGGSAGWGFVQGKTYLGSYLIPNPASGAFSWDISGLGLADGTKVTVAITYSSFARPKITSVIRTGSQTTLTWTGDNGGPFALGTHDTHVRKDFPPCRVVPLAASMCSARAALAAPWTAAYAPNNRMTITDAAGGAFYRVVAPLAGMTTLCAPPVTLP